MKIIIKYIGQLAMSLTFLAYYGCSAEDEDITAIENSVPQDTPCVITIDLDKPGDSRLALNLDNNAIKSKWESTDGFTVIKYGNDSIKYEFTLTEGAGTSVGTFASPTTPPESDYNFFVYYPSETKFNSISFRGQVQDGDNNPTHMADKITMYHLVGHYSDIRFNNDDYSTTFNGGWEIKTNGSNFRKNTIIKIDASNLPVDFQPVSLDLEVSNSNIITFWESNNSYYPDSRCMKASMTLNNFDKDKSFIAYMAQSVNAITFPAGSSIRLTIKDAEGETYYSDKYIDEKKVIAGGKLLTMKYDSGWVRGNNSNYTSTDKSADGTYYTLQTATVANGINIVFLGDGFSDRQIADGTYEEVMNEGMEAFFSEEPFKSFRDYFNVYYVVAVSDQEGCLDTATSSNPNNTTFKTYFGNGTHVGGDGNVVLEYTRKIPTLENLNENKLSSIVMMNSTKYAGTCHMSYLPSATGEITDYAEGYAVSYFPIGTSYEALQQVLVHEANGHGFGKLADEYGADGASQTKTVEELNNVKPFGWFTNVDVTNDMTQIKWSEFNTGDYVTYEGIGAYEGAFTNDTGFYRPTENSIMRYNTGGFNAPSRKAIYVRIHKMVYGDSWSWEENKDAFLEWDKNNIPTSASSYTLSRSVPENFVPLAPPVVTIKKGY